MRIKITEFITDYDGKPVESMDSTPTDKKYIDWRFIVFTALNTVMKDEILTAEQKSQSFQISTKIYSTKEPDLTLSERSYIIERVDKIFPSPLICGRAKEYFDQKTKD